MILGKEFNDRKVPSDGAGNGTQFGRNSSLFQEIVALDSVQKQIKNWPSARVSRLSSNLMNYVMAERQPVIPAASRGPVATMLMGTIPQSSVKAAGTNIRSEFRPLQIATLNRDLLELLSPSTVKAYHLASTPVVQPHDQRSRWRWLSFWLLLFIPSLVVTSHLNQGSALFLFYRNAISRFFLTRHKDAEYCGKDNLHDFQPENNGLPFPIYLASWLKLDNRFGNRLRSAKPVIMTPEEVRIRDKVRKPAQRKPSTQTEQPSREGISHGIEVQGTPQNLHVNIGDTETEFIDCAERTKDYVYDAPGALLRNQPFREGQANKSQHQLTLDNTIAVSGSAVTPQMTQNSALALLMDFFGMRLGLWFRRPGVKKEQYARFPRLFIAIQLLLSVLISVGVWFFFAYVMAPALLVLASLLCVCLYLNNAGYPFLVGRQFRQRSLGAIQDQKLTYQERDAHISENWPRVFVADGGFYDFLGVTELLRRECELIVVSDAGVNSGETSLESLARMCEMATSELGVRFVDLDHDSPIDFMRLTRSENRTAPQPFLAMRIIYPAKETEELTSIENPGDILPQNENRIPQESAREGLLFYAQMAITDDDPIEIRQIQNRFPSFPDEPTTNQFYTEDQVTAYRHLGYHIGSKLCSHLQRWSREEIEEYTKETEDSDGEMRVNNRDIQFLTEQCKFNPTTTNRRISDLRKQALSQCSAQPLFVEIVDRLERSYLQANFEEHYYKTNDLYSESIWRRSVAGVYPSFPKERLRGKTPIEASSVWLDCLLEDADLKSRYLESINYDINRLSSASPYSSRTIEIPMRICDEQKSFERVEQKLLPRIIFPVSNENPDSQPEKLSLFRYEAQSVYTAHLVAMATACQLLHSGRQNLIFQTGGRKKLCTLLEHLVQDLVGIMKEQNPSPNQIARAILNELCEMNESVFQDSDGTTLVSFAQCLCKELAYFIIKAESEESPSEGSLDLHLDFRQLFHDAIESGYRSSAHAVLEAYLRSLANIDSTAPFDSNAIPGLATNPVRLRNSERPHQYQPK
ncbi:MAG: hypothetical protein AAF483_18630 [Planctomycetota bacterium]